MPIATMRQNRLCAFAICTLLGFLFWGCGTSKKALPMKDRKGEAERLMQFEQFKQTTLPHTAFRLSGTVSYCDSSQVREFRSGVILFVSPHEGLALSLRPLSFVEAGTLYLSPQHVMAFDKINQCYVATDLVEIGELLGVQLTYPLLESLIFGLYLPLGEESTLTLDREQAVERCEKLRVAVAYHMQPLLVRPSVVELTSLQGERETIEVTYSHFQESIVGILPQEVRIVAKKKGKALSTLTFSFRTPRPEAQIAKRLSPPSTKHQTEIPLHTFLKAL